MKIALCQFEPLWQDKPASHARVAAMARAAALPRNSLLLLAEMFATGFSMDVSAVTDSESQESQRFLSALAAELGIYILGGVVNTGLGGRGRNEAIGYGPDGAQLVRYCKLHPFSFAGETAHYAPGERIVTFEIEQWKLAPLICYDLRFPEPFRAGVRRGVHLFTILANWPAQREAHWITLLQARAIENQAYVAGVNRCGRDPQDVYAGRSLIIDPRGKILVDAGSVPRIISADLDRRALDDYRREFPALADMRNDLS